MVRKSKVEKSETTVSILEQMKKLVKSCNKDLMQRNAIALSHNKWIAKNKREKGNPFTKKLDKLHSVTTAKMEQINQLEQKIKEAADSDLYENKLNTILSNYILTKNNHVEVQTKIQHPAKGRKANLASKSGGVRGRNGRRS